MCIINCYLLVANEIVGECGNSVNWRYNSELETLIVYGNGDMYDYAVKDSTPWFSMGDKIRVVIIEDGVLSIGKHSFEGLLKMDSINISNSVTIIGSNSFKDCYSLKRLYIPPSVLLIDYMAFYDNYNLQEVQIGEGLQHIADNSFKGCHLLSNINFPNSLKTIGYNSFDECMFKSINIGDNVENIGYTAFKRCDELESINVSEKNKYYSSSEGVLFTKDKSKLIFYPQNGLSHYRIPDGTKIVDKYSFEFCNKIKTIYIPKSVLSIGYHAFYYSGLDSIYFNELGNISIDLEAFAYTNWYNNLTDGPIYFNNSLVGFKGVQSDTISITDGTTYISNNAFYGCSDIKRINIPNSVVSIGDYAFCNCIALDSLIIPNTVTEFGDGVFIGSGITYIKLPDTLTRIPKSFFGSCKKLQEITLPLGCNYIGDGAFDGCTSLKSFKFPDGVDRVNRGVFAFCSSLSEIYFNQNVRIIDTSAFVYCTSLTNIIFPETLETIAFNSFGGCTSIDTLRFPESLIEIGQQSFRDCEKLAFVSFPDSLKIIGKNAFYNCVNLDNICVPKGVVELGGWAFEKTKWYNSQPYGITYINNFVYRFKGTYSTKTAEINNDATIICESAFTHNNYLTDVIIGQNIKEIRSRAFADCPKITSISIPKSTYLIGECAFQNCTSISTVFFTNGLKYIERSAFERCLKLTSVYFPSTVLSIGEYAFTSTALKDIYFNSSSPPNINLLTFFDLPREEIKVYIPSGTYSNYINSEALVGFNLIEGDYSKIFHSNNNHKIYSIDNVLYVINPEVGSRINIYNLKGELLVTKVLTGHSESFLLNKGTIYIIHYNDEYTKVLI